MGRLVGVLRPGPRASRGATLGVVALILLVVAVTAGDLLGGGGPGHAALGGLFLATVFALVGGLVALLFALVRHIPPLYVWALAAFLGVLAFMSLTAMSIAVGVLGVGLGAILVASALGGVGAELLGGGWRTAQRGRRAVLGIVGALGVAGLLVGGIWLLGSGTPADPPHAASGAVTPLALPDPSQPGPYVVRTLTYGSGTDRRRPEYADAVALRTSPVDGTPFVEGWGGLRTAYWGFGLDALPRNARVWYPEGRGPFPLVLFVHGQHPMVESSEPGYAYLGELLASRGFVVASIDENYLNLSPLIDLLILSGLKGENDLRAWLLLEHLALWREWAGTPGNPFAGKVDLEQVVLVGHSRGGEAVAVAAAFNALPRYPDDGHVAFDYGFGIRGVVAIAPVDRGYVPAGRAVALHDVSYLVLHGAHDMDVFVFQGAGQYARVSFSPASDAFKAGLYIEGANHGQFNTVWGRKDLFEPLMRLFNLRQLMPAEDQQQIARVAIGAFVEATLRGQEAYRALFQDPRRAAAWLPDTVYLPQYMDARTRLISTYEEDVDLGSTTLPGGEQRGSGLTLWHEGPVPLKWEDTGNHAVTLGWDGPGASYTIRLSEAGVGAAASDVLVFGVAQSREDPTGDRGGQARRQAAGPGPLDLTLELEDAAGEIARLPLSDVAPLLPPVEGNLGKAAFMALLPTAEPVLVHYEFPLAAFAVAEPAFDAATLVEVRFVFDRTPSGAILLDDVGLRAP